MLYHLWCARKAHKMNEEGKQIENYSIEITLDHCSEVFKPPAEVKSVEEEEGKDSEENYRKSFDFKEELEKHFNNELEKLEKEKHISGHIKKTYICYRVASDEINAEEIEDYYNGKIKTNHEF